VGRLEYALKSQSDYIGFTWGGPASTRLTRCGVCTKLHNTDLAMKCRKNATILEATGLGHKGPVQGKCRKMLRVLSTHLFLNQRLHPGLLELASRSGAEAVEIFAARQHFDYTSREHVSELGTWFRSNSLQPYSMHAPLFPDHEMGRAGAPAVNVLHPEKARRIDAMDEMKRALESAERVPFRNLVMHLGESVDTWSPRTIEYALTAVEHLGAFAQPLGVRILIENLLSEPTTPEHLMMILEMGHLSHTGICLDLGHAHITVGVGEAIATMSSRITQVHVHDNKGLKDDHLWPGDGTIDWPTTVQALKSLKEPPALVLEISQSLGDTPATVPSKVGKAFGLFE
jgi:sugar phosphate isomerase/epimerase